MSDKNHDSRSPVGPANLRKTYGWGSFDVPRTPSAAHKAGEEIISFIDLVAACALALAASWLLLPRLFERADKA